MSFDGKTLRISRRVYFCTKGKDRFLYEVDTHTMLTWYRHYLDWGRAPVKWTAQKNRVGMHEHTHRNSELSAKHLNASISEIYAQILPCYQALTGSTV